jgi:hypothetical protein
MTRQLKGHPPEGKRCRGMEGKIEGIAPPRGKETICSPLGGKSHIAQPLGDDGLTARAPSSVAVLLTVDRKTEDEKERRSVPRGWRFRDRVVRQIFFVVHTSAKHLRQTRNSQDSLSSTSGSSSPGSH